jgi:hypothetical protein
MIKKFEDIAQKEAEGAEKAWERHYSSRCWWPGRSDSDEIVCPRSFQTRLVGM